MALAHVHRLGTDARCEREALGLPVEREDPAGTEGPGGLHAEEPDRAGADHGDDVPGSIAPSDAA